MIVTAIAVSEYCLLGLMISLVYDFLILRSLGVVFTWYSYPHIYGLLSLPVSRHIISSAFLSPYLLTSQIVCNGGVMSGGGNGAVDLL